MICCQRIVLSLLVYKTIVFIRSYEVSLNQSTILKLVCQGEISMLRHIKPPPLLHYLAIISPLLVLFRTSLYKDIALSVYFIKLKLKYIMCL